MKLKFIEDLRQTFESSIGPTEQFQSFCRRFKTDFTKYLESIGATHLVLGRGHFEISGFFTVGSQAWYFSIGDVRWNKNEMLLRTASDYKDFKGGHNQFVSLATQERFEADIARILAQSRPHDETLVDMIVASPS
jgi:hypothetical protein